MVPVLLRVSSIGLSASPFSGRIKLISSDRLKQCVLSRRGYRMVEIFMGKLNVLTLTEEVLTFRLL